ncbi:AAA family ATPase [candidate division WOR-3 bacterium]|nr:AAA family ATPase [candidate division WOR-3 bacterium]
MSENEQKAAEILNKKLTLEGREREISMLVAKLQYTLSGEGIFALVTGADGIGKTRFLEEFRSKILCPPFIVLHGKASGKVTFMSVFSFLISSFLNSQKGKSKLIASLIPADTARIISAYCPLISEHYPYSVLKVPPAGKEAVFDSFLKIIKKISSLWPLVIVIDDADYMDSGSIEFLEYLGSNIYDCSIFVIAGALNTGFLSSARFSSELIVLKPLDVKMVEDSLRCFFQKHINREFVEWVHFQTKGIPFFIDEIIKTLLRSNIIYYKDGTWKVDDFYEDVKLPENVAVFLKEKFEKLSKEEYALLSSVSVLESAFPEQAAVFISENIVSDPIKTISSLVNKNFLVKDENSLTDFQNPLIRKAIFEITKESDKKRSHRKAARFFSKGKFQDPLLETYHLTRFLTSDEYNIPLAKKIEAAADHYKKIQNWESVAEYMKMLVQLMKEIPEFSDTDVLEVQSKLLIIFSNLKSEAFNEKQYTDLITRLFSAGLIQDAVSLSNFLSRNYLERFEYKKARKLMDETISLIPERMKEEKWKLKYNNCLLLTKQGHYTKASSECEILIKEIDSKISPSGKWYPMNLLGSIFFLTGKLQKARNIYELSVEIADKAGDKNSKSVSFGNLGLVLREIGEIDLALKFTRESFELFHETGNTMKIAKTHDFLSSFALIKQDLALSKMHSFTCRELAEKKGMSALVLESRIKLCRILLEEMDFSGAEKEFLDISREHFGELESSLKTELSLTGSYIQQEKRQFNEAMNSLEQTLELCKKNKMKILEAVVLSRKAQIRALLRNPKKAVDEFILAENILKKSGAVFSLARQKAEFGLCLKGEKGNKYLLEAFDLFEKMRLPEQTEYFAARSGLKTPFPNLSLTGVKKKSKSKKLKITTFGGLTVEDTELKRVFSDREWGSRKAKELLALLLVFSGSKGATREMLENQLWPDKGPKESQNNFHVTLTHLRKTIGAEAVICEEPFYRLDNSKFTVDCYEFDKIHAFFEQEKNRAKSHSAERYAREAVSLYKGDFLPEMYALAIDDEQLIYREKIKEALLWLAQIAADRSDINELRNFSHTLLSTDPFDERAHRFLMESYILAGDRNSVLNQYKRLCRLLDAELGVTPEQKTRDLVKGIEAT